MNDWKRKQYWPLPAMTFQVIALNVSYSLPYDSVPRSGSLKVIINSVPAELLKNRNDKKEKIHKIQVKRFLYRKMRKLLRKPGTWQLNTVTNLQRRFSQVSRRIGDLYLKIHFKSFVMKSFVTTWKQLLKKMVLKSIISLRKLKSKNVVYVWHTK